MTSLLDRLPSPLDTDAELAIEPLGEELDSLSPIRFWAPPVLGLLVGVPLVVYSFYYAATHNTTQIQFDLFWVGILAFAGPAVVRALSSRATPAQRWALIAAVGAWDFFPKFLRNPGSPLYADELAHYRQVVQVTDSHHLYPTNYLLPIIRVFPGQQALVSALHAVTGLSIWTIAELTLLIFHVGAVVGVMALAARLTGSYRAAAIAALVFTTAANFMFFDSQFSYESFALPMVIWTLVAVVHATGRGERPGSRWAWVGVGTVTTAATIFTHHLSSYILAGLLLLIAVGHSVAARRNMGAVTSRAARRAAWTMAVVALGGAGLWLLEAHEVISYYQPYVTSGVNQVIHILNRSGKSRQLFKGSTTPLYEQLMAFAGPPLLLALAVVAFVRHRRRLLTLGPTYVVLASFGVLGYFVSLPFLLTAFGNEGGRRSWTFSYIGIGLLAGPVLEHYLAARRPDTEKGLRRRRWSLIVAGFMIVLLIGNTSASVNTSYRFPGPYVYGSDTRSLTDELMYVTQWFEQTQPANPAIISDRYTGLPLGGFAGANLAAASKGFPFWQMYFNPDGPPVGLLVAIGYSGYNYLIVDDRMAQDVPLLGVYFSLDEPDALTRTKPVPVSALDFYHQQPWATEVLNSNHYSVYRFNNALLQQLQFGSQ